MSKEAIQAVVDALESLPETDQRLVLDFLARLSKERCAAAQHTPVPGAESGLALKDGLLVFRGQLTSPGTDWIRVVRDERDDDLLQLALGRTSR